MERLAPTEWGFLMLLKTGNQLRAARVLVGLDQGELAKLAGVNINTISAMEKRGDQSLTSGLDTINDVVRALETLGIEFTNGEAIGVRLRNAHAPKPPAGTKQPPPPLKKTRQRP
jgi:DNA-binding XRE family transcriptional regulator